MSDLIKRYKQEFEIQSANNISENSDTISFRNNNFRFIVDRFANRFSSFSQGQIKIVDEGDEFGIYFEAKWTRLFTSGGILAGIAILLSFFSIGFKILPLFIGVAIFALLIITGFISTSIFFPVYFTSLRNNIEREFQKE